MQRINDILFLYQIRTQKYSWPKRNIVTFSLLSMFVSLNITVVLAVLFSVPKTSLNVPNDSG